MLFLQFRPWQNTQKISKSESLYNIDNFFYKIVVSTVKFPLINLSNHTKCKDLAAPYKNQTTGTAFLD